jgi:hypothetical protein
MKWKIHEISGVLQALGQQMGNDESTYLLPLKSAEKTLISTCFHPSHKNSQMASMSISTIQTKHHDCSP